MWYTDTRKSNLTGKGKRTMRKTEKRVLAVAILAVLLIVGMVWKKQKTNTGEIYLYGESHSN